MKFFFILFALLPTALTADILTSTRVIRPNTVIEPQDISVLAKDYPGAIKAGENIIGQETRNTLYPGRPIRQGDIGPVALVKRNQHVKLIFRQGGLVISTEARSLQRGAIGEFVRVMNMSSRTTVSGMVTKDGSVEVMGLSQ